MIEITVKQRQYLKSLAHNLTPVVMIGNKGITPQLLKEVEVNLTAHELIKIRVLGDDRKMRVQMIDDLCKQSNALLVQHIGKLLVLYRAGDKIILPTQKGK